MAVSEVLLGDCLEVMKTFPDNHFSAVVTDPPYGLSFMGKDWDHGIPGKHFWEEAIRICKPGSFLLAFGGTRTHHRLTCSIEDAGWEIRDCLLWIYGSGFPKSHNHFGCQGYGTALKPAYEPIIMAMKNIEGTFKQNAEKWGQAGINIDGCRIPTSSDDSIFSKNPHTENKGEGWCVTGSGSTYNPSKGRWPANIIFDEEAAAILDEQSGILKSGGGDKGNKTQDGGYGKGYGYVEQICIPSSGGASRFFYCAKTSSKERGESNKHPTVKPLALMRYLITLIAPPTNALILDPFAGSGSTILAAKQLGINAIGIEKQPEYVEIARARLAATAEKVIDATKQIELF